MALLNVPNIHTFFLHSPPNLIFTHRLVYITLLLIIPRPSTEYSPPPATLSTSSLLLLFIFSTRKYFPHPCFCICNIRTSIFNVMQSTYFHLHVNNDLHRCIQCPNFLNPLFDALLLTEFIPDEFVSVSGQLSTNCSYTVSCRHTGTLFCITYLLRLWLNRHLKNEFLSLNATLFAIGCLAQTKFLRIS